MCRKGGLDIQASDDDSRIILHMKTFSDSNIVEKANSQFFLMLATNQNILNVMIHCERVRWLKITKKGDSASWNSYAYISVSELAVCLLIKLGRG